MPIAFSCSCGQSLVVDDGYAGVTLQCPACSQLAVATRPATEGAPTAAAPKSEAEAPDDPFGFTGPGEVARDRNRRAQEFDAPQTYTPSARQRGANTVIVGGGFAMVIAVVWFVAGLMNDVIFFYPPVLFVIGLLALVKGLTAGTAGRR